MLIALWPHHWSRQQRSNATLVAALILMVLALAFLGQLLSFLPEPIGSNAQAFSDGARTTLWLTLVSGSVGLVLGTSAALGRTSRWRALRWIARFYIWVIRGTPLLVQILFVYFALPVLVPGLNLPDFAAAVVALGLNVGAYNAEAVRAGLLAVPRGQTEAARAGAGADARVYGRGISAGFQNLATAAGQQLCRAAEGLVAGLRHWRGRADQRRQPHPVGHFSADCHAVHGGRHLSAADYAGDANLQRHRVPL